MSLSEEQVQRYSRQILLAEVGGRGQERLLASGVELTGAGPAQTTAAAYLAAAGCPIYGPRRAVKPGEQGFLFTCDDVGGSSSEALRTALEDMNPDALAEMVEGCLGEVPASFSGSGPWIALGRREGRNEVLYRAPAGCRDCFAQNASAL
ncbi:MAG TPA: ThiF family adenylyltransferase, partial [Myxococcaceae bacterium]|nr:ThiF family adenylyltransferase [Myxococcaceae bacterium]